ncbi:MAG: helix-turn-helix domain-containing protein [Schleiferilactobacillus harbinensis]|nr:helix-turn-helix domain-containing protein [Schleiferilactobacillus harbinensis]
MKFNLREEREKAGLTQAQLSDKSGVPQTTISGIENSGKKPNVVAAHRLADALGVTMEELLVEEAKN